MTRRTMLSDLEIDEVSTVDRPANQHGLITFSKRLTGFRKSETHDEEGSMPPTATEIEVFDSEGAPVDVDSLEHGALVYDEEGNEYMYADPDEVEDPDEDDDETGGVVGKAFPGGAASALTRGRQAVGSAFEDAKNFMAPRTGPQSRGAGGQFGQKGRQLSRNGKLVLGGAGAAGAAGAAGYATTKKSLSKSLGDSVLEELSKAVTQDEQRAIIAKALDEVQVAKAETSQVWKAFEEERNIRLEREFIAKADEYNLPVEPEAFGPVLKRLVERMDEADLEVLDQVFKAAGDLLFNEYGHVGGGANSSVIDEVDALASQMVSKAGGAFSTAEAQVALLEANPEMYDLYIQEGRF